MALISLVALAFVGGFGITMIGDMIGIPYGLSLIFCLLYGVFIIPKAIMMVHGPEKEKKK